MDIGRALRLYVIPDRTAGFPRSLLTQTEEALRGGATAIQLRDKQATGRELLELAHKMALLCHKVGAMFIVNDRLDIALLSGADGVHVGQDDLPVSEVRKFCPPVFVVGASVHTPAQAVAAADQGADYLGIGAVASTATKGEAKALGIAGIKQVADAVSLPSVAIGGINLNNAQEIITSTGVSGLSIISAIVGAKDIAARTEDFLRLLDAVCPYEN